MKILYLFLQERFNEGKNKNLQKFGKETLLSNKIKTCLKANIGKVIVSTNSQKVSKYAESWGPVVLSKTKRYSTVGPHYFCNFTIFKIFNFKE